MDGIEAVGIIDEVGWVEPVADGLTEIVEKSLTGTGSHSQPIRNFLHGTWLGHPLHPVLTDIPIGAWTVAAVFDTAEICGLKAASSGADAAVAIGLLGAMGSALTGLADWHVLEKGSQSRKVGTVHAVLNIAATLLYAGSLILRKTNHRNAARALSALGYGVVGTSAYLGGILVYDQKIGVDHAVREGYIDSWTSTLPVNDLEEGKPSCAKAGDVEIVLLKQGGEVYALANACSHLGGPLCEGTVEKGGIMCPWHRSLFDFSTGRVINGPATAPQPAFKTRVVEGVVEVKPLSGG